MRSTRVLRVAGTPLKRRGRRPIQKITPPQTKTLQAIKKFVAERKFPPTVKELGAILGITAASVHDQLKQLARKGFIRRAPRKARALEILRSK